jgi:sulfoxide reductase heme-binding subunit YedZ
MRHVAVAALSVLLSFLFWRSRMEWDPEMRLWKAAGDASFALLVLAMAIGPLAVLLPAASRLLAWRRALGIWFALLALWHSYLVWDGWARWSFMRLMGYEVLTGAPTQEPILTMPGFGLANLMGIIALVLALLLAAVSSERALRGLGTRAWKHVQQYSYVVFYIVALHTAYFMFLHYDLSLMQLVLGKGLTPPNWFRFWFVGASVLVLALQVGAFAKIAMRRRGANAR